MSEIKKLTDKADYCRNMATTIADKLWFESHFQTGYLLLDIGCADGSLMWASSALAAVGYDNDPDMVKMATDRMVQMVADRDVEASSNWDEAVQAVERHRTCYRPRPLVMNLASTLHEVPSLDTFEDWVNDAKPEYISIRDLGITRSELASPGYELWDLTQYIRHCSWGDEFIQKHGLHMYKPKLMWLLKQQWQHTPNFYDDLAEDYFIHTIDSVMFRVNQLGYRIAYFERYMPQGLRDQIAREYGVVGPYCTHYKLLAERIG